MAKIWLNAGHGGNDPGAYANGRSEAVQAEKLTRAVGKLLSGAGHTVWYTRDVSPYMATYVPYENGKPADIFVSFHQNSGGGRGYESFVTGTNNCALACAKALAGDMKKIWSLRGSTYGAGLKHHTEAAAGSLYVVSGTVSPAFLGEFGFIDSTSDMKIFDDNFDYIVRCCANQISQAVGGKEINNNAPVKVDIKPAPETSVNNETAGHNAVGQSGPNPKMKFSGEYDPSVKALQRILQTKGYDLAADGIAGPVTYKAVANHTVEAGERTDLVKWIQNRLNLLGFNAGTEDGYAGAVTMAAIGRFQKHYGLGVGYLGGTDWYYAIES